MIGADPEGKARRRARRLPPALLIARKEWLDLYRDSRWRALTIATLVLAAAALATGVVRIRRLEAEHHAAEAGDRRAWTSQGAKNPHAAAHFGQYAFKPVSPLSAADPGIDPYVGSAVHLVAHTENQAQFPPARDASLVARMGVLTLAFVFQTVLPLTAILLGAFAFSAEREAGTLRQLLSLGVRPVDLLMGKGLAASAALLGLLLTASAALATGLALYGPAHPAWSLDDGLRIASMAAAYALYVVGFLALAAAASARAESSRTALMGLLVYWLLNSFVVPRWAADVIQRADPLPTALELRKAAAEDKRKLFVYNDANDPTLVAFHNRIFKQYGVDRVEDLPVSYMGLSLREDDRAGYKAFDRGRGRLQAQIERQDAWRAAPGFLFPMLALQPFSMSMAGTDNRGHHDFVNAAERHRRRIQDAASQDLIDHARDDPNYVVPASTWDRFPAFEYERPSAAWAWRGSRIEFGALAAWCAGCCVLARISISRLRAL